MQERRIPELDGLRALAVLAVLLRHCFVLNGTRYWKIANFGWAGVDLFFVLSGFLITGILFRAKGDKNYYRNFYARRVLRIWPAYFLLLLAVLTLHLLWPQLNPVITRIKPWAYVFFVQNLFPWQDFGAALQPTWSLGVEEQFYMFWPFLVAACSPRGLLKACGIILVISPLARLAVAYYTGTWELAYTSTYCRIDALGYGAAVAVLTQQQLVPAEKLLRLSRFGMAALGAVLLYCFGTIEGSGLEFLGLYSVLALFFACVLVFVLSPAGAWLKWVLRLPPLRYVGKISYGLYLCHVLCFALLEKTRFYSWLVEKGAGPVILAAVQIGVAVAVASISWFAFENPILRLKGRFAEREAPLAAAAAI